MVYDEKIEKLGEILTWINSPKLIKPIHEDLEDTMYTILYNTFYTKENYLELFKSNEQKMSVDLYIWHHQIVPSCMINNINNIKNTELTPKDYVMYAKHAGFITKAAYMNVYFEEPEKTLERCIKEDIVML